MYTFVGEACHKKACSKYHFQYSIVLRLYYIDCVISKQFLQYQVIVSGIKNSNFEPMPSDLEPNYSSSSDAANDKKEKRVNLLEGGKTIRHF